MLSSQAQSGVRAGRLRSLSTGAVATTQICHFWSVGRRSPTDWTSHLDPHYARFHRQRNINTRAKMLKSIRRRQKWAFGSEHEQFFTPRHVRLASHYHGDGHGKSRWQKTVDQEDGKPEERDNGDGYELSAREKLWKEQMEGMRQRVEKDPYEAIFGKRFEPFWGPLIPAWMRDELGLSKETLPVKSKESSKDVPKPVKQPAAESETPNATTQAASYAYSSSTSWDSWTNKAKKSEWDSITGETKHFEYDPISNRMIRTQPPQTAIMGSKPAGTEVSPATSKQAAVAKHESSVPQKELRKAIAIPHFVEPAASVISASAPSSPSRPSSDDIDALTAYTIRSRMGKRRSQDEHQIQALLQESHPKVSASSRWDHAEQYCMLEQELENLKAKKEGLMQEERRAFHFGNLARRYEQIEAKIKTTMSRLESLNNEQIELATQSINEAKQHKSEPALTTALQRGARASRTVTNGPLRPAVDRMQTKTTLPAMDLDDAAAHESTESVHTSVPKSWSSQADLLQAARVDRTASKIPYPYPAPKWVDEIIARKDANDNDAAARERAIKLSKAKEMLQAEVDRQKLVMTLHEERYTDDIRVLRGELANVCKQTPVQASTTDNHQELGSKIEALESAEKKYKAKIAALKQELDIAYKQSSRHADEFRDQIMKAERRSEDAKTLESKYRSKLETMKGNLDLAYKQSSRHADEFRDQIRRAERRGEDAKALGSKYRSKLAAMKDNLDLAYKQSSRHADEFRDQIQKAGRQLDEVRQQGTVTAPPTNPGSEKKSRDRALVREIRGIYEKAYGTIGKEHKLPRVNVDSALADFDKLTAYAYEQDGLDKELLVRTNEGLNLGENAHAYDFKEDGLEDELRDSQSKPPVKSSEGGMYRFRQDNLEAELASKPVDISAEPAELDEKSYAFKHDNLEAELAQQGPDANTARQNRATLRQKLGGKRQAAKPVNPIDGTAHPPTGNYASPTGFVNFDPVFPNTESDKVKTTQPIMDETYDHEVDYVHYPRVKREEAVFSGTRRIRVSRSDLRRERDQRHSHGHRRRSTLTKAVKFTSLAGAILLTGAYVQGMHMEQDEIKRQGNREAWERMAQEYEKLGERGIVQAMHEMKHVDQKWNSGLFWK